MRLSPLGLLLLLSASTVGACWTVGGLVAAETLAPQCGRGAGNDGASPDGTGCSAVDLCADGWHVCESAREVAADANDCGDAIPPGSGPVFYATRQRGETNMCDTANLTGTKPGAAKGGVLCCRG